MDSQVEQIDRDAGYAEAKEMLQALLSPDLISGTAIRVARDYMMQFARRQRRAALALPKVESETWQPIETAPKDGKTILVWGERLSDVAVAAQWACWFDNLIGEECEGFREATEYSVGDVLHGATHWRPLPTPPSTLNTGGTHE